jgi:hypothetical protein
MRARNLRPTCSSVLSADLFAIAAAGILLFALAPSASAQNLDFSPAALGNQRTAIILKATHAPISDIENELNRLAVLSERCRVESGPKACGLSDKPLDTNGLDERYAYYVRTPMEAHAGGHQAKVDKHNWEAPPPPPR